MSIFTYTLPSGSAYELKAPDGTTQAQADEVFYTQVAAGSLVGYAPGQVLQSTETLIQSFELSRLERGTAGIDAVTVLALNAGLPVVATVPSLSAVPVSNAITEADVALMKFGLGPQEVGVLSSIEVQSLMAQMVAQVSQSYDIMTNEKGIGMFGFTAWQLEQAGYLIPGTTARYLNSSDKLVNPSNFTQVMNSPVIWTGLDGVTSVNDILSNRELQVKIQNILMKQSYDSLLAAGLINVTNSETLTAMQGQVYSQTSATSGVFQPVGGVNLLTAAPGALATLTPVAVDAFVNNVLKNPNYLDNISPANIESMLNGMVKNPSLLSNLSPDKLSKFSSMMSNFVGTLPDITSVVLKPLKTGVTNGPSLAGLTNSLRSMAQSAQTGLNTVTQLGASAKTLTNVGGGDILSQASSGIDNAKNFLSQADTSITQAKNVATQVQGQVGALVNNASKFGTQATEMWNKGVSGNLKDAMDNVGKMGDYAVKFAKDKISGLVSSVKSAAGFTNTINRATLDTAVNKIIGTPSITPPKFTMPNSLSDLTDLKHAQSMLSSAQNTIGQVQNEIGTRVAAVQNLAGEVQSQVAQVTGAVTNVANQVTGTVNQVTGIAGQVTGQVNSARGILSRLTRL